MERYTLVSDMNPVGIESSKPLGRLEFEAESPHRVVLNLFDQLDLMLAMQPQPVQAEWRP